MPLLLYACQNCSSPLIHKLKHKRKQSGAKTINQKGREDKNIDDVLNFRSGDASVRGFLLVARA